MRTCKKCYSLFTDALYNDLAAIDRQWFDAHLQTCSKCAESFERAKSTIEIMNQRPRPDLDRAFWDGYWQRLVERMDQQPASRTIFSTLREKITSKIDFIPGWAYRMAFAVTCVLVGIIIGRLIFVPRGIERTIIEKSPTIIPVSAERIELIKRTQRYFERSKVLMLGIVNFDAQNEDIYGLNLPHQRRISQTLVQEANLLKKELSPAVDQRLYSLISELEVILLQIANLEIENDISGIELIKSGIDREGILLKINLEQMKRPGKIDM